MEIGQLGGGVNSPGASVYADPICLGGKEVYFGPQGCQVQLLTP